MAEGKRRGDAGGRLPDGLVKFKKAVITDEISQDLEVAARLAAEFGLEGLELRTLWNKGIHELVPEERERVLALTQTYNLPVVALSSPFFKCHLDREEEIENHYAILRKTIEVAGYLGAKLIRGFAFWRVEGAFAEALPRIVARFQPVLPLLSEAGVKLVLENEPATFACNAARVATILETLASPAVGAVWDPGNDIYAPEFERPYPEGYEIIKGYLLHMHLKDARRDPATGAATGTPIGEGEVDYEGQFRALLVEGYSGYISLETHYRPQPLPEELLNRPGGEQFSAFGEEASRECLEKWFALLHRLSGEQ